MQAGLQALWRGSSLDLANVFTYVLTEMLLLFYPPFRAIDDVELLELSIRGVKAYAEDLCEFSPEVLQDGWREARRNHRVERWPTISDIRDACLAARDRRNPKQPSHAGERQPYVKPLGDKFLHRQQANDWLLTEQGQWALRHGCASDCWDHIAEHGEGLDRDKISALLAKSTARAERLAALPEDGRARRYADGITKRESEMRRQYLRDEAA